MRYHYFLLILLSLFWACHKDEVDIHFTSSKDTLHILLPLYSFPTDDNGRIWHSVSEAATLVPISVIWGLVDTADAPIYQQYLKEFENNANITLYSYVATTSGQRPQQQVRNEIDYYVKNFDIDGIFFDEVSSDSSYLDYYREIIHYAKKYPQIKKVILNCSYAPVSWVENSEADIVIIYEDLAGAWNDFAIEEYKNIPTGKKAIIVSNVWFISSMKSIISDVVKNNIGYVFITDKNYDKLPSYWDEEVNFIYSVNNR